MRLRALLLVGSAGLCAARSCVPRSSSSLAYAASTATPISTTTPAPTPTSDTTSTESPATTPTTTVSPPSTENRLVDGNFDSTNGLGPWQTAILPASDTSASISIENGQASAQSGTNYAYLDTKQAGTSFQLCQPINLVSMYNYDFSAYIYYLCRDPNMSFCSGSGYATVTFALGSVVSSPLDLTNANNYAPVSTTLFYDGASGDNILACITVSVLNQPIGDMEFYLDTLSVNANLGPIVSKKT